MIKAVIFDCFGVVIGVMSGLKDERMVEMIQSLKGKYKLAVLSNVSSQDSLERRFAPGELQELFDVIVASGDVGWQKSDPEIYTMTAEKLGVSPNECLFIDDIESFTQTAASIGMQTVRHVDFEETKRAVDAALV